MNDDKKTFIEKWSDFWFWFDPFDFFMICLGVSMLIVSVSGSFAILRMEGLI